MTTAGQDDAAPILVVVVLFRTSFEQSRTLNCLTQIFADDPTLLGGYELLVWDNSPTPLENPTLPFAFRYQHVPTNPGVAGAYNGAAEVARERGAPWLLLLDQDTAVTDAFLRGMRHHAAQVKDARDTGEKRIAAIAPFLFAGDFQLSPRLWRFARHVRLPRPETAYDESREIFAANSGVLIHVDALRAIGGYSPRFWLDYSDIDAFHRFHRKGFAVRIAADLALEHEVAMLDYNARMTPGRYATYLAAESDFIDLYRGRAERAMHLARLFVRALRQRRFADPSFSRMSWRELWRRLRKGRADRLRVRA